MCQDVWEVALALPRGCRLHDGRRESRVIHHADRPAITRERRDAVKGVDTVA